MKNSVGMLHQGHLAVLPAGLARSAAYAQCEWSNWLRGQATQVEFYRMSELDRNLG